ncbi:unnamed protein product, partial [Discosporangium mesarthrocarpum]
ERLPTVSLCLRPPLMLHNLLCTPMLYRLVNRKGLVSAEGVLPVGVSLPLRNVDLCERQYLSLCIINYPWSTFVKVHSSTSAHPSQEKIRSVEMKGLRVTADPSQRDSKGRELPSLYLQIAMQGRDISVFCRVWIVNRTGMSLMHRDASLGMGVDATFIADRMAQVTQNGQDESVVNTEGLTSEGVAWLPGSGHVAQRQQLVRPRHRALRHNGGSKRTKRDRSIDRPRHLIEIIHEHLGAVGLRVTHPLYLLSPHCPHAHCHVAMFPRAMSSTGHSLSPGYALESNVFGSGEVMGARGRSGSAGGEVRDRKSVLLTVALPLCHLEEVEVEVPSYENLDGIIKTVSAAAGLGQLDPKEYFLCPFHAPSKDDILALHEILTWELDKLSLVDGGLRALKQQLGVSSTGCKASAR